jgi:DNA-binding response OmpR family regulator
MQSFFEENKHIDYILEENSIKGLKIVKSRPVDLIILDLMMPEMNGYQFLEKIRSDSETRNIPIMVLSAIQEEESLKKAMELGASGYMKKPLNIRELEKNIGTYFKQ